MKNQDDGRPRRGFRSFLAELIGAILGIVAGIIVAAVLILLAMCLSIGAGAGALMIAIMPVSLILVPGGALAGGLLGARWGRMIVAKRGRGVPDGPAQGSDEPLGR